MFRLDVPAGTTAVANGLLSGRSTGGGRAVWTYVQRQPTATELTQIAVGDFAVTSPGSRPGVSVRDVTPCRLQAELTPNLAVGLDHPDWLEDRVGDYPFDVSGSLVVDAALGFALGWRPRRSRSRHEALPGLPARPVGGRSSSTRCARRSATRRSPAPCARG